MSLKRWLGSAVLLGVFASCSDPGYDGGGRRRSLPSKSQAEPPGAGPASGASGGPAPDAASGGTTSGATSAATSEGESGGGAGAPVASDDTGFGGAR